MPDNYIPIYKGYAPGEKPPVPKKQKSIMLRTTFYSPAEPEVHNPLTRPDDARAPADPTKNVHVMNQARQQNIDIYKSLPGMGYKGYEYQEQNPLRPLGFWENPQRIVRFKDYIDNNPTAVLPEWLNKDVVNTAYEYLKYANNYASPDQWKALPEDSPVAEVLRGFQEPPIPESHFYNSITDDTTVPQQSVSEMIDTSKNTWWQKFQRNVLAPQGIGAGAAVHYAMPALGAKAMTTQYLTWGTKLLNLVGVTKNPALFASPIGLFLGGWAIEVEIQRSRNLKLGP